MSQLCSVLKAVTVHLSGATVTRVASVLGACPAEVRFGGLPLSLVDGSVRVEVQNLQGEGRVLACGLKVGVQATPLTEPPAELPDETRLKALRREAQRLEARLERLSEEMQVVDALPIEGRPEPAEGRAPNPSPLRARVALEAFADELLASRQAEVRALRVRQAELAREINAVEDALERTTSARKADLASLHKEVKVSLTATGAVTGFDLALSYRVPGARWAPLYQVRLDREGTRAEILTRAVVCQRSGEDWRGVKLSLSTANPHAFTRLPELPSLRIGKSQPPPPKAGFRPPPRGAEALFADFDAARAALLTPTPPPSFGSGAPSRPASRPTPKKEARGGGERAKSRAREMSLSDEAGAYECEEVACEPAPAMPMASMPPPPPSAPGGPAMRRMAAAPMAPPPPPASPDFHLLKLPSGEESQRGRLIPQDRRALYQAALDATGLYAPFDLLDAVESAEREAAQVNQAPLPAGCQDVGSATGAFAYRYDTATPVDVVSDGHFHTVPVDARVAACDLRYVLVPRVEPLAYRVASLRNPSRAPLLPGPVEVYVGGEYVLKADLPAVGPGADFELGLGVEQAIQCARNTRFSETRSGDKVVATALLTHAITIELVNHLSRPARCQVRERLPQPAPDAEVVVEEQQVSPPWVAYDQSERHRAIEGGRLWEVTVPPGGRERLEAAYVVKIYAQNELVGGNRREQ